jgi:choline-sulfatase
MNKAGSGAVWWCRALAAALCVAGVHAVDLRAAEVKRRANVIAIVTDDQARWTIGAYGNRDARTPNMDRLAAEGALFVNAFVNTPVCSPSRASFLTGLHGTQVGITDWINVNEASAGVGLPPETVTWPEVLRANGYATALLGKWHLGHLPQHHPTKHGYDHFWGFLGGGTEPMDPHVEVNGTRTRLKGPVPDLLTDEAMRWVEANRDKPFALSLHFREPHLPYAPVPDVDAAVYRDADVSIPKWERLDEPFTKNLTRRYYSSVHAVDRNLGRLLAKLDELKLADNTIVLFTSDHGYNVGHHVLHGKGNANWIGGGVPGPKRPNMFDSSIRVPLLIRWPAGVKAGTRIEQPVMNLDTFSTVLAMTGIAPPADVRQHGRDFSPLLRGETVADWRTDVFGQYDLHNAGLAFMRMIRSDEWKLVVHHMTNGSNELYNLKDDPEERRNRYYDKKASGVREDLRKRLVRWQESVSDPILKLDADRPFEMGPPVGQ